MHVTFLRDKIRTDEGGASFSLHLLAERLSQRGHKVEVVTVHHSAQENVVPDGHSYTITERPLNNYTQVDGALKVYKILSEIDTPDVLHSFQPQLHPIVGAWKRRGSAVPVVGRLNTYQNFCTNVARISDECYNDCTIQRKWAHHPAPSIGGIPKMAFDTWAQPKLLNEFDAFHAQSPAVKDIFAGYGIDQRRLTVVPNFYEQRFGNPIAPRIENDDDEKYRILYVGRLSSEKGVHLLLEAANQATVELEVDVVGDGPEFDRLAADAGENVTMHGWVDHEDLPTYYNRADVYVHPGLWPDPCPRSVIEAMQFECVPVVTDTGGPPWMVGNAGLTVPRGEIDVIVEVLEDLERPTARDQYVNRIPEELERFAPKTIIEAIETTYRAIV